MLTLKIAVIIAGVLLLVDIFVTWRAYRLDKQKRIQILERRLEDYRRAATAPGPYLLQAERNRRSRRVLRLYYGACGPVYITIREFDDEDEDFNQREAEELLAILNQK